MKNLLCLGYIFFWKSSCIYVCIANHLIKDYPFVHGVHVQNVKWPWVSFLDEFNYFKIFFCNKQNCLFAINLFLNNHIIQWLLIFTKITITIIWLVQEVHLKISKARKQSNWNCYLNLFHNFKAIVFERQAIQIKRSKLKPVIENLL